MKKIVKDYIDNFDHFFGKARNLKREYDNEKIRIGVSNYSPSKRTEFYYYNPVTEKIKEGAVFLGNGSQYSYKHIGSIEIRIIYGYDFYSVNITRIIRPIDENMSYADQYEESKFPHIKIEEYNNLQRERDKLNLNTEEIIIECVNCDSLHIVSQENVEKGKIIPLNYEETEIICSQCTDQQSIRKFIDKYPKYEDYLIDFLGLSYEDDLFL